MLCFRTCSKTKMNPTCFVLLCVGVSCLSPTQPQQRPKATRLSLQTRQKISDREISSRRRWIATRNFFIISSDRSKCSALSAGGRWLAGVATCVFHCAHSAQFATVPLALIYAAGMLRTTIACCTDMVIRYIPEYAR